MLRLLGRLRPTKLQISRLVKIVIKNSHFQAQSVKNLEEYQGHWSFPVYHPETGYKQSLDALLWGQKILTVNTSLTNEIGRLIKGISKNIPAHKKLKEQIHLTSYNERRSHGMQKSPILILCETLKHKKQNPTELT